MHVNRQLLFSFALVLCGTAVNVYGQDSMITPDHTKLVNSSAARINQTLAGQVNQDRAALAKAEQAEMTERQQLELAIAEKARAEQSVLIATRLENELRGHNVPLMEAEAQRWGQVRIEAKNVAEAKAQQEKVARDRIAQAQDARKKIESQVGERTTRRAELKERLKIRYEDWGKNPMKESWLELTGTITFVTNELEIKAAVQLNSTPNNGALIKYQSLWDRKYNVDPMSSNNPTGTTEQMGWGWYYMWSERNGKATSDRDRIVKIDEPTVTITIIENR